MSKKDLADAKRIDNINKTYVCDDGIITKRKRKLKEVPLVKAKFKPVPVQRKPWLEHLKAFFTKKRETNPSYNYKTAMLEASASYVKPPKDTKKDMTKYISERGRSYKRRPGKPKNKKEYIIALVKLSGNDESFYKTFLKAELEVAWLDYYKNKTEEDLAEPLAEPLAKPSEKPSEKPSAKPSAKPSPKPLEPLADPNKVIVPIRTKILIRDLMYNSNKSKEHYKKYTKEQLQKRWLKVYSTPKKPPKDTKELIYGLMDLSDKDEKYFKKMTRAELEKQWYNLIKGPMS